MTRFNKRFGAAVATILFIPGMSACGSDEGGAGPSAAGGASGGEVGIGGGGVGGSLLGGRAGSSGAGAAGTTSSGGVASAGGSSSGGGGAGGGSGGSAPCATGSIGGPCTVAGQDGACANGTEQCVNGTMQCVQTVQPSTELCDGVDNDCDGTVDNGIVGVGDNCDTGQQGECAIGARACTDGQLTCTQTVQPVTEICNSLDDDCDGDVDNGTGGGACTIAALQGPCAQGVEACLGGAVSCVQTVFPLTETCNGTDDDCDGTVDNPAAVDGKQCETGLAGVCAAGMTLCDTGVQSCVPSVSPGERQELCNDLDDDCDGVKDEDAAATMCARECQLASIPSIDSVACSFGACSIGCAAGLSSNDNNICNGCEATTCPSIPATSSCANPHTIKADAVTYPAWWHSAFYGRSTSLGGVAWIAIDFTDVAANYNGLVALSLEGSDYTMDVMDVIDNCTTAQPMACPVGQGGPADTRGLLASSTTSELTWWDMYFYNPSSPTTVYPCPTAADPGRTCTVYGNRSNPDAKFAAKVLLKVTRVSMASGVCAQYTIGMSQRGG